MGLTPPALRACGASLRLSKFVPDEFVEPGDHALDAVRYGIQLVAWATSADIWIERPR